MKRRLNHQPSGFTLTELAIVLGIIGVILGAIWTAAANVQNNNRASQAAQDILAIASNVRSTFKEANSFPATMTWDQVNIPTPNFITLGIIPTDLVTSTTTANSVWGVVAVWTNVAWTYDNRHFLVSFYGTPPDVCFRIISQLASMGTNDGPVSFDVNATDTTNTAIPHSAPLLSTTTIATQCNLNSTPATASTEVLFAIH